MKHPILTRSVSLLLALVMLLAFPAAALEQVEASDVAPETASGASEQTGLQDQEAEPYLDEDGNFNAPKKLTVYYTARLDGSDTADMMPEAAYTGVAAFFDYAQDEELETPYFFYYEDGRLQDDEERTVQSSSYLKLTAPHEEAEDAYYAEEVYVDEESEAPATYAFFFNRADGGENGPILPEEEQPEANTLTSEEGQNALTGEAEPQAEETANVAPSGLALSQKEDGSTPTLSWSAVSGAVSYYIYRRADGGAWEELARTSGTSYTDQSALASGVTYTYDVRAAYDGGALSPEGESTVSYRLHPVPAVTLKSIAGGMQVTWTRDSAATGYRVYRSAAGGSWQAVADLGAEAGSYLDEGAQSNQKNAYQVRAYYGDAGLTGREDLTENVWSGASSAAELYYLAAPALKNVYTSSTGMVVEWNKVDGVVNYSVWRKTSPESKWTRLGYSASTSYTDKTAEKGTAYYYTVVAHASAGSSHFYENATGYVLHGTPVVQAGRVGAGVRVTWTLDPDATGYFVFRRVGSAWVQIARAGAKVSSYQDDEPAVGTNYYTVRAYYGSLAIEDASLNSRNDWGGYESSEGCVYYEVPKLGAMYNSDTGITFTWTKTSGAAGYTVYRKTASTGWTRLARIDNGSTTSYVDTTAAVGVDYYYTVCAFYGAGGKEQGGFVTPEESVRRYPDPAVSAIAVSGGISLSWKLDSSADGYRVWRLAEGGRWVALTNLNAGVSSYLDTSVTSGVRYIYQVRAYYGGTQPHSVSFNAATGLWSGGTQYGSICYLDTPEIGAIRSAGDGMEVNWTAVGGATGYLVYRRPGSSGNWTRIATVTGQNVSRYVDATAVNNTAYSYTVRAFSQSASANNWGDFERTAPAVVYHAAPTVSVTIVAGGFKLSWTKDAAATGYRIYRQTSGTSTKTLLANCSAGTTSYTDTTVANSGTYTYTVHAYYGSGAITSASESVASDWSGSKANTYIYYDAPVMTGLSSTATGLKLTWKKVSGAAGYRVYRKTSASASWVRVADVSNGATEAYVDTSSTKLASGTTVYYTVRAIGADRVSMGDFDRNGQISVYLGTPELDKVKVSSSGATVTWKPVGGAQEYVIYRKPENGSWQSVGTSKSTSFLDTAVKKTSTTYYYTVRATCTVTASGRKISAMGYYDRDGITFGIEVGGNGWISKNGNTYYGVDGFALTGWQYLNRNGGRYKYYFDPETGALVTNLYAYFGKSYRELQTRISVNLTNQSSNPGQVMIFVYNSETKAYDIPTATFRCVGSLTKTFAYGNSGFLRKGKGTRWERLVDGGAYEQYCIYINGTPSWFHSALYYGASNRKYSASTYNSLVANKNSSNGCIRLQCLYVYLIMDIMKNGYGASHNISVTLYKNSSSKGPFGVPQVERISTSLKYDPTDPSITGKFFYATSAVGVSVTAGADDWCTY